MKDKKVYKKIREVLFFLSIAVGVLGIVYVGAYFAPTDKGPEVVAELDAAAKEAGEQVMEVPSEIGKSLGRVMDTITKPVKKAFSPRVESKEMEKNTKAHIEKFLLEGFQRSLKITRIKSVKDLSFQYVKYEPAKQISGGLRYSVIVLMTYTGSGTYRGENAGDFSFHYNDIYVLVASRSLVIKEDGSRQFSGLENIRFDLSGITTHDEYVEEYIQTAKTKSLPELERKYFKRVVQFE